MTSAVFPSSLTILSSLVSHTAAWTNAASGALGENISRTRESLSTGAAAADNGAGARPLPTE